MNAEKLIVCWGLGQDSSGMLAGMMERGMRPWKIIFADVGSERKLTYEAQPVLEDWLVREGFPRPETVRYVPKNFKHWPHYYTLLENCLTNVTLPSLAYGFHTCSAKWKIAAINAYVKSLVEAKLEWRMGRKIDKAIGFDSSPWERKRAERGCQTFAIQDDEKDLYRLTFPLQEWGWTREDCVSALLRHGQPVPPKSSCFFCPAMKPDEVDTLTEDELKIIVILEARTRERHLQFAEKKGWPRGVGVPLIEGLWRRRVLGMRGATPKPGSITEYIRKEGLVSSEEIDRLILATPTQPFTRWDFQEMGFQNWEEWLEAILRPGAVIPLPEKSHAEQLSLL